MIPAQRRRVRAAGWWLRAGACAAGVWFSALPALAQPETAAAPSDQPRPSAVEPTLTHEPSPIGIDLPDQVTVEDMKGQYAVGVGILILGGLVTAGALYALLTLLVRRTWSELH